MGFRFSCLEFPARISLFWGCSHAELAWLILSFFSSFFLIPLCLWRDCTTLPGSEQSHTSPPYLWSERTHSAPSVVTPPSSISLRARILLKSSTLRRRPWRFFFQLYPYIILSFFFILIFCTFFCNDTLPIPLNNKYYDMLRCRGVSCKVKYILDAEKSTIIYMIISVHPVALAFVFLSLLLSFCPPVVVFSDRPAVSSEMTSTLFVSWRHRVCLTEVQRSSSCPIPLQHPFSAAVLFDI